MRVNYLSAIAMASILSLSLVASGCGSQSSAPTDDGAATEQADPCAADPCAAKSADPCAADPCAADPCAADPCAADPCAGT
ncbi:MAG: hypothetical protein F6K04_03925 [Leptolyngbya sp. SIO4C5]|uniref:hypothetical protein n=1 Tax=Sphaerothrix gracilis TaxID=3151835 RepID=UPI0013C0F9C4|nr:hypothetical protein [Leptolyngbya sp. SIO4C5]